MVEKTVERKTEKITERVVLKDLKTTVTDRQ